VNVEQLLQPLLALLAEHGALFATGTTMILAGGCLGMLLYRDPQSRRCIGSFAILGVTAYLVLASVPLPRWELPSWRGSPVATVAASSTTPLPVVRDPAPWWAVAPLVADAPVILSDSGPQPSPEEAVAPHASAAPMPWREMLASIWLLGAALTASWLLLGRLALLSVLRSTRPGPSTLAAVLPARTRLRLLDRAITPFCCGLWWPAVVLPSALAEPSRRSQALAVLRHEGAHLRGGDLRLQTLLALLLPLLWWQPLFWWLRARIRLSAEMLADAAAAEASGVHGYVRDLLDLAEARDPVVAAPALSVFRRRSELTRRIEMLLHRTTPWSSSIVRRIAQASTMAALATASVGFFGVAPASGQDPARANDLRVENRQLQDEIAQLRASIAALRERLAQAPTTANGRVSTGSSVVGPATTSDGEVVRALRAGSADATNPDPQQASSMIQLLRAQNDAPAQPVGSNVPVTSSVSVSGPAGASEPVSVVRSLTSAQEPVKPPIQDPANTAGNPTADPARQLSQREIEMIQALMLRQRAQAADPVRVGQESAPTGTGVMAPLDPFARPKPAGQGAGRGGDSMSMLELASRAIQLRGEVEIASADADRLTQLVAAGAVDTREVRAAQVKLQVAKQTLVVAQRLVEAEIEAATDEVKELKAAIGKAQGEEVQPLERRLRLVSRRLEALTQAR
jgi:beta-lactamase regulating signal transducer with metallopeptidase domain